MLYIRQGATHKVVLGPAVAVGDGFTPVTTLTLSGADEAEAILHDNGTVVDISGYTFAAITTADGYYHLTLQSGISGTVGHMTIVVNDDSLILPLRADFTVLEESAYDMLFAGSALGYIANAPVNVAQVSGDGTAADTLELFVEALDQSTGQLDSGSLANGTITAASIASDAITDAKVAADVTIASVTGAVGSVTGNVGGNVVGSVGSVTGAVGSVTGNVGGNVTGSVGSLATQAKADVNAEVDTALGDYDALVPADLPANFAALGINASGHVSRVTLVDTTTTNTDMRGTDDAALATDLATVDTVVDAIKAKTDNLPSDPADQSLIIAATNAITTAISTAQSDLDILTGTDGVTLATTQPNYAPSTHSAADVWAVGTRVLTAGTNIMLAKGTGVTGFTDVSTADVQTAAAAALTAYDPPTKAELDSALDGIPKVGGTHRYTNEDTSVSADVTISEVP